MIIFVFEVFGLNISLGVGGYNTHKLLCLGDTFSAEIIVTALYNLRFFFFFFQKIPHTEVDDKRDATSL